VAGVAEERGSCPFVFARISRPEPPMAEMRAHPEDAPFCGGLEL